VNTTVLGKFSPSVTKMIRMDHSHVLVTFHKYTADAAPERKKAIVASASLALEIHAQLEEEIFYPALADAAGENEVLLKAKPEHDEMRRLIAELRAMEPGDAQYDARFMQLMREVIHHVADEETVLLPAAEAALGAERLSELGAQMARRRMQLARPHMGAMAMNQVRAMPASTMLVAGGLLAGAWLLGRGMQPRRHH
jgi:hemerythrin superfamily protein